MDDDGGMVAVHESRRCVSPDLDHGWPVPITKPTSTIP
jgi:hypothetical protein